MARPQLRGSRFVALALALGVVGAVASARQVTASDHQQTPLTELNPRLDVTDVWVFPGSSDDRVVLAMTVASPLVGDRGARFDPNALYQLNIDNSMDGVEDVIIQFSFDEMMDGTQTFDVVGPTAPPTVNARLLGPISGLIQGGGLQKFANARPTIRRATLNSTTASGQIGATTGAAAGTMQAFAGLTDDPFFIDLEQFFRIIPDRRPSTVPGLSQIGGPIPPPPGTIASAFRPNCGTSTTPPANSAPFAGQFGCATDFLRGFNALVIVVELPEAQLTRGRGGADPELGVWATISR